MYGSSALGLQMLHELVKQGHKLFTLAQAKQIAPQVGLAPRSLNVVLNRLKKGGWIDSIRRGLYCVGPKSGFTPPHEYEIAHVLAPHGVIGGWTALMYHHLTQQIPSQIDVFVPGPTRKLNTPKLKQYRFHSISKDHLFGIAKVWIQDTRVSITDPERTVLQGLLTPQFLGGFQEVLYAFRMGASSLDLKKLIAYALQLNLSACKRLGWVLEYLKFPPRAYARLAKVPSKGFIKLDSTGPAKGQWNRKWMIRENLGESKVHP